jgi:hypothetical protein
MRLETGIEPFRPILWAVERGEGQSRGVFAFIDRKVSHRPDELIAIHLWHADIAYDDIESLHLHPLQPFRTSRRCYYFRTA